VTVFKKPQTVWLTTIPGNPKLMKVPMANKKQAIIINYAPGCQRSALAIDIGPQRHKHRGV